jgi:glyoxylase-like metal-dependent hydrolase (beta-lactamase superfamily II)
MSAVALKTETYVDQLFAQNTRVVYLEDKPDCWLIDPGLPPATGHALELVALKGLEPRAVLLTHAHSDHIAGVPEVTQEFPQVPVYLAQEEWSFLADPMQNLSFMAGLSLRVNVEDRRDLVEGDTLELSGTSWQVLNTSGHSPGGRTFYCADHNVAIVGDSLFHLGVGRVDFPHSNGPALVEHIKTRLLTLPPETRILPGHGPETTVAVEKASNPYVGERASMDWF